MIGAGSARLLREQGQMRPPGVYAEEAHRPHQGKEHLEGKSPPSLPGK
ncbi:hypothetical protein KEH51_28420 [[Brevibacterium] frigoritolerans]|uniref:Uncharacterized protein n=1 Tax=Peribacillus frigoritolerans TaxID=450367 RepID=A0A941J3T0_9BACI|nr:hypothetical protein [Peribacillus frigoritolerans]